jgi:hypothetical protein
METAGSFETLVSTKLYGVTFRSVYTHAAPLRQIFKNISSQIITNKYNSRGVMKWQKVIFFVLNLIACSQSPIPSPDIFL